MRMLPEPFSPLHSLENRKHRGILGSQARLRAFQRLTRFTSEFNFYRLSCKVPVLQGGEESHPLGLPQASHVVGRAGIDITAPLQRGGTGTRSHSACLGRLPLKSHGDVPSSNQRCPQSGRGISGENAEKAKKWKMRPTVEIINCTKLRVKRPVKNDG
jgi:hypothetical protein